MIRMYLLFFTSLTILLASVNNTYGIELIKSEKCAICHIYDSIYFDAAITKEHIDLDMGGKKFCLSCHNGSVIDSREKLLFGFQHPPVFNGNDAVDMEKGRGDRECTSCHTPHTKLGWKGYAGEDISIYTGGDKLCSSCHPHKVFAKDRSNHTYKNNKACLTCHTLHGAATKTLLRKKYEKTCDGCHKKIYDSSKKKEGHPVGRFKKKPVIITGGFSLENVEDLDLSCYVCHDLHQEDKSRKLIIHTSDELCRRCHSGYIGSSRGDRNNGNHPEIAKCTDCHNVHSGDEIHAGKGLGKENINPLLLCAKCHSKMVQQADNSKNHISDKTSEGEYICLKCHSMHGGVLGTPNLVSEGDVVCIDCHGDHNTINEEKSRPMAHKIFATVRDGATQEKIYSLGGKLGKHKEIICRSCHSVHGTKEEQLLLAEKGEICHTCHEGYTTAHGKSVTECTTCHSTHGLELVKGDRAQKINRGICGGCHEGWSTHSAGGPEIIFPNLGRLPLFDEKGRKATRGYIGCSTCHGIHGKEKDHSRLRNSYGGSSFLCLSCHPEKEKISLTPHDLRGIASNNLCEPCHVPHGGEDDFMWGIKEGGEGEHTVYCDHCHGEGGIAREIQFGEGHSLNIIPKNKEEVPFTFYDTMWYENELGMITCPTCHDIHGESISFEEEKRKGLLHLTYGFGEEKGYIERQNFCTTCHREMREMVTGFHGQYDCESCHSPHSDLSPPEDAIGYSWSCIECHTDVPARDALVFEILGKEIPEKMRTAASLPIFDRFGKKGKGGVVSCPSCHNVHSASKVTVETFRGGKRIDETCFICHSEKREYLKTGHDLSKGDGSGCNKCHKMCTEGISPDRLKKVTGEYYANPADGNCLICHAEKVKGGFYLFHPKKRERVKSSYGADVYVETDILMVSMRPERAHLEFPLFTDKGEGNKNGYLGCLTCHDPHRTNKIKGKKNMFLRDESSFFVSSICLPCHKGDGEKWVKDYHYMKREEE